MARRRTLKTSTRLWLGRRANQRSIMRSGSLLLLLIAIPIVIFAALHIPIISVSSVQVSEESDVTDVLGMEAQLHVEDMLFGYWYGIPNATSLFFQKERVARTLEEEFSHIGEVEIHSGLFGVWSIVIGEKKIFGTHCTDVGCLHIDQRGVIFAESDLMQIGRRLILLGDVTVGDSLFPVTADMETDFLKIQEVLHFLEDEGVAIESITVQKGEHDVHIETDDGFGIWVDLSEGLYDIIQALYVTLVEVFPDQEGRAGVSSIILCDPLQVYWTKDVPWTRGCLEQDQPPSSDI